MKLRPCHAVWIVVVGFATFAGLAHSQIHLDDFASVEEFNLVGDARIFGRVLRLTSARSNQTGAAWLREKQTVRAGFDTTFQFQLTHQDWFPGFRGADGFAFVVQNSGPEAIGGRGSAAGFGMPDPTNPRHPGIPWMIAVFFDTLRNSPERDPSSNYIGIRAAGAPGGTRWPTARLAFVPTLSIRLKDRQVHTARIVFEPPVLSVFLENSLTPALKTVVDFSLATDHNGSAWVGFTAATGLGYQNHDILNWSFTQPSISSNVAMVSSDITFPMSACLPNRNLCTPERALIEHKGARYHVVLPANLEWGASIPNPSARPVDVMNAKGIVCWDVNAAGPQGCAGPSGNGGTAETGFLATDAPARALIVNTHQGRTWVSVNGRKALFKDNEGFYEFDLEIR